MKFKAEFLRRGLYGDTTQEESFEIIEDEISDHTRWNVCHDIVFKHNGKLYESYYQVGATEMQDEQPWEYEMDEVECPEVEAYEKTITAYRAVT